MIKTIQCYSFATFVMVAAMQSASAADCKATLYQHTGYEGAVLNIYGSVPKMSSRNWNDKMSSVKIISGKVCFYRNTNFRGNEVCLPPGEYARSANEGIINDSVSSIKCK